MKGVRSLRGDLMRWLLGALSLGAIVLVIVAYTFTLSEMNEVLDENLREVADAVAQYHAGAQVASARLPSLAGETTTDDANLITLVWRRDGTRLFTSNAGFPLPFGDTPGPSRSMVGAEEWRIYTVVLDDAVIQAAQRTTARHQMAAESASKLIIPLAVIVGIMAVLLVVALRRGLRPWDAATQQITMRSARSLDPISDTGIPQEMRPLVHAFNALMARLSEAFVMQRRFVADAAHELRSPVTALRLQLTLLERAPDAPARQAASDELRQGIERSERLVQQLLQLSRAEPEVSQRPAEPVDLDALVRSVVSEFNPEALRRGIDLGAAAASGASVLADEMELRVLLNNLVRNALRYSPVGAQVDVISEMEEGRPVLRVVDTGPGIPLEEQSKVFERFRRGSGAHVRRGDPSGSGLGLAIVQAIAGRHGATTTLRSPVGEKGLEVKITFSRREPPARHAA